MELYPIAIIRVPGTVSGSSSYVGGLVGSNLGTISNSYYTGAVSGSSQVGGLIGRNWNGTISNSYSTGTVSGSLQVGGLIGYSSNGTVSNSYWDTDTSGLSSGVGDGTTTGTTGLSTADMQSTDVNADIRDLGQAFDYSGVDKYPLICVKDTATCTTNDLVLGQ